MPLATSSPPSGCVFSDGRCLKHIYPAFNLACYSVAWDMGDRCEGCAGLIDASLLPACSGRCSQWC
eukprot:8388705-Prorocentrum_lima.AAC.1